MPVFKKKNLTVLFVHVPKTAGSSINKLFLENGFEMSYYSESSREPYKGLCGPQHMDRQLLIEEFGDFSQFDYMFSVYRDPLDRHLSEFTWAPWGLMGHDKYTSEAFEDWTRRIFKVYERSPYQFDNHIRPQSDFYIEGMDVYDYEDISNLPNKLCAILGMDMIDLPYERSSRRDDFEYVIYEETAKDVEDFYKNDYTWRKTHSLL